MSQIVMILLELGLRKQVARVARLAVAAGAVDEVHQEEEFLQLTSVSHLILCIPIAFGFSWHWVMTQPGNLTWTRYSEKIIEAYGLFSFHWLHTILERQQTYLDCFDLSQYFTWEWDHSHVCTQWEVGNHREPMLTHSSRREESVIYAGGRIWPGCLSCSAKCQVVGTEPKHKDKVKPHYHQFGKVRLVCPSVSWGFVVPPLLNHRQLYFSSSFYCLSFVLLSQSWLKETVQTQGEG